MSYDYQAMRHTVFTEAGVANLLKARDAVDRAVRVAGAVRADKIIAAMDSGDSWAHLAVIDYMVETNLLKEVSPAGTWGQYRVFVTSA